MAAVGVALLPEVPRRGGGVVRLAQREQARVLGVEAGVAGPVSDSHFLKESLLEVLHAAAAIYTFDSSPEVIMQPISTLHVHV